MSALSIWLLPLAASGVESSNASCCSNHCQQSWWLKTPISSAPHSGCCCLLHQGSSQVKAPAVAQKMYASWCKGTDRAAEHPGTTHVQCNRNASIPDFYCSTLQSHTDGVSSLSPRQCSCLTTILGQVRCAVAAVAIGSACTLNLTVLGTIVIWLVLLAASVLDRARHAAAAVIMHHVCTLSLAVLDAFAT